VVTLPGSVVHAMAGVTTGIGCDAGGNMY